MKLGLFSYISTCIYFFTRSLTIDTSMYNLTGVLILVVTDEKWINGNYKEQILDEKENCNLVTRIFGRREKRVR